jgi:ribosomal protein S16
MQNITRICLARLGQEKCPFYVPVEDAKKGYNTMKITQV